ncbi:Uncharacterised protein [uncultured archaeon]|nr:Uncharacterised protein [uncultured archaeon]
MLGAIARNNSGASGLTAKIWLARATKSDVEKAAARGDWLSVAEIGCFNSGIAGSAAAEACLSKGKEKHLSYIAKYGNGGAGKRSDLKSFGGTIDSIPGCSAE